MLISIYAALSPLQPVHADKVGWSACAHAALSLILSAWDPELFFCNTLNNFDSWPLLKFMLRIVGIFCRHQAVSLRLNYLVVKFWGRKGRIWKTLVLMSRSNPFLRFLFLIHIVVLDVRLNLLDHVVHELHLFFPIFAQ